MIEYRTATLPELKLILDWAGDEGWNPGLDDAEAFFAADRDGFFVAVDRDDTPIAAISVVNHTPDFAFLGLYIVRPAYRGRGIGFGLWAHAMQHAKHRTVGLDGVEAQQQNYRASGFVHAGGTTRFTGHLPGQHDPDIRRIRSGDIPALIQMEAEASGVAKPTYLQAWFSGASTRTTIVLEDKGVIGGFCTVRSCRSGAKIGPLVAADTGMAYRLIAHAATTFDGPVTLDVPETSAGLADLCERFGLEAGFKTARMYRGSSPARNHPTYAVTSLELG
ncbi:GNAT family N-acetyltransferase [uncultured Tateyamaria sp.]|uniref:GNAT family N-acetyltransferase n=1 Tax=uncultured Tateyamaria sp. TaxID=455651 RepID=UPI002627F708|nr:GNAT family N-acetyltransferase [uncultured Tateyamaria sp.]